MSIHDEMDALADVYAGGGIEAAERLEVERHAASCGACAAALRDARDFASWLRGAMAPDAPPADLENRIVGMIWKTPASPKRRWRLLPGPRMLWIIKGLAAAALLVVIGHFFSRSIEGLESRRAGDASVDNLPQATKALIALHSGGLAGNHDLSTAGWAVNGLKYGGQYFFSEKDIQLKEYATALEREKAQVTAAEKLSEESGKRLENLDKAAKLSDAKKEIERVEVGVEAQQIEAGLGVPRADAQLALFQDNRKIIRNARVDLEVESCETAQRKVAEVVATEKGFVAGADTERLPNNKMKAVVTLRIPPDRFEAVLAQLRELGTVRHQSITSQEVTKAYMDLEARLGSKQALVDRLKKVLAEAKGNVKELMEVEVQMGKTIEEIESIKGELKYYDNQVALATIILRIAEKDLGQPFEYVQTLQSAIGLTVKDPDDAYAKAQKAIIDAGGQVVDSKMTRQNDGSAQAAVKGRVDAEKFPAVREDIRKLGHVDNDTVDQQKTARGGSSGTAKPDAPVCRELAVIDLTIATPPILVTRKAHVVVEAAQVEAAYQAARKAVEAAEGRITSGSLAGQSERMSARVQAQVDADKFSGLVEQLKALGKLKNAGVSVELPANATGGTARPITERADLEFVVASPPRLIPEEKGLVKVIRDTFSGSVSGLLWSIEKLFVGICLAGPWLVVGFAGWILVRRLRRRKAPPTAA